MQNSRESISKFISLASNDLIPLESKIQREANVLSDLIRARIQYQSVDNVAQSLIAEAFNFRLLAIKLMKEKSFDFDQYFASLDEEISIKLQVAEFSELDSILSKVHLLHSEIFSSLLKTKNISSIFQVENAPLDWTFDKLNYFLEQSSRFVPENKYYKKWLEESLKMEIGLILSDWILTDKIQNNNKVYLELTSFFRKTITRFGAYSILLDVWRPGNYHTDSITNDMETLAATIRIDSGVYKKMNLSDLSNLIEN